MARLVGRGEVVGGDAKSETETIYGHKCHHGLNFQTVVAPVGMLEQGGMIQWF